MTARAGSCRRSFTLAARESLAGSAFAGSEVVGMPGFQARPLGGGASVGPHAMLAFPPLWPAVGRVLPCLVPPVDSQIEQPVAVVHRLDAAHPGPISFEDFGFLSQVANEVHHADPASNQKRIERAPRRRVP